MIDGVELLRKAADGAGGLRIVGSEARFKAVKHTPELRQLAVDAHRLQAHAADSLAFVIRLLVQDVIFGAVEFVSERFRHTRNGVGKLVDH
jgi:hypothetical protein